MTRYMHWGANKYMCSLELQLLPITTRQVISRPCRSSTTSMPTKSRQSRRPTFTGTSTLNWQEPIKKVSTSPMHTVSLVFMLIVFRLRENIYNSTIQCLWPCRWGARFAGHSKSSLDRTASDHPRKLGPRTRWHDRCWKEHLEWCSH